MQISEAHCGRGTIAWEQMAFMTIILTNTGWCSAYATGLTVFTLNNSNVVKTRSRSYPSNIHLQCRNSPTVKSLAYQGEYPEVLAEIPGVVKLKLCKSKL